MKNTILTISICITLLLHNTVVSQHFAEPRSLDVRNNFIHQLHSADINNDGYLDIITHSDTDLILLLNDGMGNFERVYINTNVHLSRTFLINTGDINNDGLLDVICTGLTNDYVVLYSLYVNEGNNEFMLIDLPLGMDESSSLSFGISAIFADQNDDGLVDILISSSYLSLEGGLVLIQQVDNLEFEVVILDQTLGWTDMYPIGNHNFVVAKAIHEEQNFGVLHLNENNELEFVSQFQIDNARILSFDIDLDGNNDYFTFSKVTAFPGVLGGVTYLYSRGDFAWFRLLNHFDFERVQMPLPHHFVFFAEVNDFTGDGNKDILTIGFEHKDFELAQEFPIAQLWLWNEADFDTLSLDYLTEFDFSFLIGTYSMVSGDFTGNGLADLVFIKLEDDYINVLYFAENTRTVAVEPKVELPNTVLLHEVYPNPFNNTSSIYFELPHNSNLSLAVYDVNGRLLRELYNGTFEAGSHTFVWEASDLTTGVYLIKLETEGGFKAMRKAVLIK